MLDQFLTPENAKAFGGFLAGCTVTVITLLYQAWKRYRHRKSEGCDFEVSGKSDMQVHDLLTELRLRLAASRASVCQFHNGEHYFSGSPIQKSTCTHESVNAGMAEAKPMSVSVPTSLLVPITEVMFQKDPKVVWVDEIPESFARSSLESLNVIGFAAMAIRQGSQKVIGYVIVHWTYEPVTEDQHLADPMAEITHKIEGVLANRLLRKAS